MPNVKISKKAIVLAIALLSPILICLSYPCVFEKGCWQTGLIMFVPCLYVLYKLPLKWASIFGIYVGTVSMAIVAYPMMTYGPQVFMGCGSAYIGELFYGGPYYALLFSLCAIFLKKKGFLGPVLIGFAFALITWFQVSDTLLSPVYFSIPSVLWREPLLLQTADIWGTEGIAFLMGFTQGLIVKIIIEIEEKNFQSVLLYSGVLFLTIAFVIAYGIHSTDRWGDYRDEGTLTTALIQHNGPNRAPGSRYNIEKFHQLAEQAKEQEPNIIISAESLYTMPVIYLQRMGYLDRLMADTDPNLKSFQEGIDLLEKLYINDVPVLIGTQSSPANEMSYEEVKEQIASFDHIDVPVLAAVALMKDGVFDLDNINEKAGLSVLEKAPSIVSQISNAFTPYPLTPGDSNNLMLGEVNIGCFLCIEDSMRFPASQKIKDNAQVFVTMGSAYDTLGTRYLYQHLSGSVFTSIACRRSLLRACNSGITCAISMTGDVIQELTPCRSGFLMAEVPLNTHRTLYSFCPLWFGTLTCIAIAAMLLSDVIKCVKSKKIVNAACIFSGIIMICYFFIAQKFDWGIHLLLCFVAILFTGPLFGAGYSQPKTSAKDVSELFLFGTAGPILFVSIMCLSCTIAGKRLIPDLLNQYAVEKNGGQIWRRQSNLEMDGTEYEVYLTFMDDGDFCLTTVFDSSQKWITIDRCNGVWNKDGEILTYIATSQVTGGEINEKCKVEVYTVKEKEKMVLVYEDGTGETFVRI